VSPSSRNRHSVLWAALEFVTHAVPSAAIATPNGVHAFDRHGNPTGQYDGGGIDGPWGYYLLR